MQIGKSLGAISGLVGLIYLGLAIYVSFQYSTATANAIQLTQIWSEGTYKAAVAIALFAFSGLMAYGTRDFKEPEDNNDTAQAVKEARQLNP